MGSKEIEEFITYLAVNQNVAASTQNQALHAILFLYRYVLTDAQLPPGCLIANSTLECGGNRFEAIGRRLSQCHAEIEAALYSRLRLAQAQGQISEAEDVQALAQFLTATMLGMGAIARTNPDPVMIRQLAKTALRVLPNASKSENSE
jgi:hypothetical protein